jgi:acylphosphatase
MVRNLRDGRVEVFCEGPREIISAFVHEISLLGKNQAWFGPRVDGASCSFEDEQGFSEAWREYSNFEIDPEWG